MADQLGQDVPLASDLPKAIGAKMRGLRRAADMSQNDVGVALAPYLGAKWSRQQVSSAEHGTRNFTANELAALAAVFHIHPGEFFDYPTVDIDADRVRSILLANAARDLRAITMTISSLAGHDTTTRAPGGHVHREQGEQT